jgi:hypothetical protein
MGAQRLERSFFPAMEKECMQILILEEKRAGFDAFLTS